MSTEPPLTVPGEKMIESVLAKSRDLAVTAWGMSTRRMRAVGAMILFL
jgi:hypothetical protein